MWRADRQPPRPGPRHGRRLPCSAMLCAGVSMDEMNGRRRRTPDEYRQAIARADADGRPRNDVARELGVDPARVSRMAQALGFAPLPRSGPAHAQRVSVGRRGRIEACSRAGLLPDPGAD